MLFFNFKKELWRYFKRIIKQTKETHLEGSFDFKFL